MNNAVRTIRHRIRTHTRGRKGTAIRYPVPVREAAVSLARERSDAGTALCDTARELGLRPTTLYLWLRRKPGKRLRPVAIVESPAPTPPTVSNRPVLITPHGYRIEGLAGSELIELLRRLS